MELAILIIIFAVLVCGITLMVLRIRDLIIDKDYYGFPAVTKCRVCDETVWEWQRYERRSFTPIVNGKPNNSGVSGSGLVHKKCKGHPIFEINITVK